MTNVNDFINGCNQKIHLFYLTHKPTIMQFNKLDYP